MEWAALAVIAVVCFGVAAVGGAVTEPNISWLDELDRPSWRPPNWIFGPVWTVLFAAMTVAAWLVWRTGPGETEVLFALGLFALQLLLNAAWSWIFFGRRSPGGALAEIPFLWAAILATILAFHPISPLAAWLLVPYLAWVTFAAVLNAEIWRRNR